jgi:abhydrolase domain-containing protein 6
LVIWGGKDRIIDVSTARVIKEKLKNSEIHILKDVGHVPNLEAPEETHKIMRNFLNSGR